jgi:multidrug efflux system membrane fusion protein
MQGRGDASRIALLALVTGTLCLGLVSCGGKDTISGATVWEAPEEAKKVAVEAVRVVKGTPLSFVTGAGVVEGIREAWTVSETEGIIREIRFQIGQWVEKGQVLLQVDDTLKRLEMERAKVQLESAQIELEGTERLFQQGGASASAVARLRGAASAAKAQYELAKKAYEDCTVRAPISGVVAVQDPSITVGSFLSRGTRILRIVDTSSFRLELSVGEREVGELQVGSRAFVRAPAACGERKIQAEVTAIGGGSDPRTGAYTVVLSWKDSCNGRLRSGMSALVEIERPRRAPVLLIPTASLVRRGEKPAVFVAREGKVEVRYPVLGPRQGTKVEVLQGISEGDLVLVSGMSKLKSGSPVNPREVGDSLKWE